MDKDLFNALVRNIYKRSLTGGDLHIVLDDLNVDGDSLVFCAQKIESRSAETTADMLNDTVDLACLMMLSAIDSTEERIKYIKDAMEYID